MPKVGGKHYAYTKKGKAAAAKARQKQKRRKGPMPKVNPEFAKEMEEANKPKPPRRAKMPIGRGKPKGEWDGTTKGAGDISQKDLEAKGSTYIEERKRKLNPQSRHFRGRG